MLIRALCWKREEVQKGLLQDRQTPKWEMDHLDRLSLISIHLILSEEFQWSLRVMLYKFKKVYIQILDLQPITIIQSALWMVLQSITRKTWAALSRLVLRKSSKLSSSLLSSNSMSLSLIRTHFSLIWRSRLVSIAKEYQAKHRLLLDKQRYKRAIWGCLRSL